MAVEIRCPMCGATVKVVTGGAVVPHDGVDGRCSFVQTARSNGKGGKQSPLVVTEQMAERRDRKKAQYAAEQAAAERRAAKKKAPPPPPKYECPKCLAVVSKNKGGSLVAHTRPGSGRWCSGGLEPTEKQRRSRSGRRSVWTVSGGLPTLGRR